MIGRRSSELSLNPEPAGTITRTVMTYAEAVARVRALEELVSAPLAPAPAPAASSSTGGFADVLANAVGAAGGRTLAAAGDGTLGSRLVAVASAEVGQGEAVPGSNDGPRIALYRSAVAGAEPGEPWCADFASWVAAQAGAPLGPAGVGFRSVAALTDWAQATGRLLPADAAAQPGDLVLFGDRHVGLVESVDPDGTLHTIEGNDDDAVRRDVHAPGAWTGLVRLAQTADNPPAAGGLSPIPATALL